MPVIFGDDTNEGTIFVPENVSSIAEADGFIHAQYPERFSSTIWLKPMPCTWRTTTLRPSLTLGSTGNQPAMPMVRCVTSVPVSTFLQCSPIVASRAGTTTTRSKIQTRCSPAPAFHTQSKSMRLGVQSMSASRRRPHTPQSTRPSSPSCRATGRAS